MLNRNKNDCDLSNQGFMRIQEVLRYVPIGKSTWWKGIKEGKFPKGRKIGPKTTVWSKKDILGLLQKIELSNPTD